MRWSLTLWRPGSYLGHFGAPGLWKAHWCSESLCIEISRMARCILFPTLLLYTHFSNSPSSDNILPKSAFYIRDCPVPPSKQAQTNSNSTMPFLHMSLRTENSHGPFPVLPHQMWSLSSTLHSIITSVTWFSDVEPLRLLF